MNNRANIPDGDAPNADAGADDAAPEPAWLAIGRELKAIAQIGLTFCRDPYDRTRFERIRELSAAVIAEGCGHDARSLVERFRIEAGYATPKVDVRAAVFKEGRVLLVREVSDGAWTLPGGWADVNESPAESAVREVAEESGFEARATKLAAVYDYRKRNRPRHLDSIYKLFFVCELLGGSARTSIETSEVAFFARHELPSLSVGRTTAAQIERMFRHAEEPGLPTDFD
jgi:ADP-ribose pyrophosphatase YjhB (NUDIX family)